MSRRMSIVHQTAQTDCAAACLAMICRYHGIFASLSSARERLDPGRDGVSARGLRDTSRDMGLECRAIRVEPADVAAGRERLPLPFVAHLKRQHYVVVERITRRGVRVIDPAVGRRTLSTGQFGQESSGLVLLFAATGQEPAMAADTSAERLVLLPLVRDFRGRLALAGLASLALVVLGLTVPWATAVVTDRLAAGGHPHPSWLILAAAFAGATGVLALLRSLLLAALQRGLATQLSASAVTAMFTRTYRFFDRRTVGDLVGRLVSVVAVRELLGTVLLGTVLDTLLTVGYLAVLLALSPALAVTALVVFTLTLVCVGVLACRSVTLRREELIVGAEADTMIVDALRGAATLRCAAAEEQLATDWLSKLGVRYQVAWHRARLSAGMDGLLATVRVGGPILFLIVAALDATSPGVAIGLSAVASALLAPLSTISTQVAIASELRPLVERLADVERCPAERVGGRDPGRLRGEIEFRDLGFRYDARSPFVFRGVNAHIPPGAKVGVLGASGCGKSTLASLLSGLHDPTEGAVLLDGYDLSELDLKAVRRQLGVVLQDTWLGGTTIRESLTSGRDGITEHDLYLAAHRAGVLDDINAMPLGFDTPLGDGGSGVSVGQRQRLALARALVARPALLILDEATSALDVTTEASVEQHLRDLRMTRIVIAHRLSTVADADLLLVLADGQLIEAGKPDELAARQGAYARMLAVSAGQERQSVAL